MSGICGVIAKRGRFGRAESSDSDLGLLAAMTDALRHRGPDDAGFLLVGGPEGARGLDTVDSLRSRLPAPGSRPLVRAGSLEPGGWSRLDVGLGIQRLAVSDPAGGHQPIGNEEGTIWVVLDGVIANARELRQELRHRGHRFATRAEAEVIVHAYEQHGWDGIRRLRGQFAIALWDDRRRLLLLARDPSGVRPLFVAETGTRFLFASEVGALRRDPSLSTSIDPEVARHFLAHGELPAGRTLFSEIRALGPGQMLIRSTPPLLPETERGRRTSPSSFEEGRESDGSARPERRKGWRSHAPSAWIGEGFRRSARGRVRRSAPTPETGEGVRSEPLRNDGEIITVQPAALLDPVEAWGVVRQTVAAYMASDLSGAAAGRGVLLDGSLASAALVLAVREAVGGQPLASAPLPEGPLPTFFLAGRGDGAARARRSARALRTEHREVRPEGTAEEAWLSLLSRLDAPPAHPGMLAPFLLCRGASESVRVAFVTGAGAWPAGAFGMEERAPLRDEVLLRYAGGEAGLTAVLQRALDGRLPRWLLRRPEAPAWEKEAWRDLGGLGAAVEQVLAPDAVRARGLAEPGSVTAWRDGWRRGDPEAARRLWALLALELWLRIHVDRDLRSAEEFVPAGLQPTCGRSPRRQWPVAGDPRPVKKMASRLTHEQPLALTEHGPPATGHCLSILIDTDADPAAPFTAATRLVREWSVRLAARGHRVSVLVGRDPDSPAADVELLDGVEIARYPVRGSAIPVFRSLLPLSRAPRERGRALRRLTGTPVFDILLMDHPAAALRRAEIGGKATRLYLFRGVGPETEAGRQQGAARGWKREERAGLRTCDDCLAPSRFAAAQLAARYGELGLTATLIPGGVDAARFRPIEERWEVRRRLGLPESAFLLFTVGPLVPGSGVESLITAMAGIHAAYPEAHLVIGGAGPLEPALRRQVVHQQLGRVVTLAGRIPEALLSEYYAAADLFVMPSERPGALGMAVVEALACGTPVFATPVGALPERLAHLDGRCLLGGTGAGPIADAVIRHLPDLHHDETLRRRCRQLALEHYDWEVLIPQLERYLYGRVARRQSTTTPPPIPRGLVPHWPCFE